jgi:hypothetical protein
MMTGSYRDKDVLEIWDLRMNEKIKNIEWDGNEEQ